MAWQKVIPIKGNRHLVRYDDTKEYFVLALKINQDNSEFYYNDALWENTTELNALDFDINSVKNNKYWAYSNLSADTFLVKIGNVERRFQLAPSCAGKTLLWLQQQTLNAGGNFRTPETKFTIPKGFVNTTQPVFEMPHRGGDDVYNITEPVFWKTNQGYSWIRAGVPCDNTRGTETSGSSHGLGILESGSGGGGQINSGQFQWNYAKWFYKSLVWIKVSPNLIRKMIVSEDGNIKTTLTPPRQNNISKKSKYGTKASVERRCA